MSDCQQIQSDIAAGEAVNPEMTRHVDGCASCSELARAVASMRGLAVGLPRPEQPFFARPIVPTRSRWPVFGTLALAGAATVALVALVSRGHFPTPQGAPLDLLASLAEAERVWMPEASDESALLAESEAAPPEERESTTDPLATLRPIELLLDRNTNPNTGDNNEDSGSTTVLDD